MRYFEMGRVNPRLGLRRKACAVQQPPALTYYRSMQRPLKGAIVVIAGIAAILVANHLWPTKSPEEISRETAQNYEEYGRQKAIVDALKPIIDSSASLGQQPTYLRGKALVWDMSSGQRSNVYDKLPDALKAKSSDSPITVFMVTTGNDVVGTYALSGPAHQGVIDVTPKQGWASIAVGYWPEKIAVGIEKIAGPSPAERIKISGDNSPNTQLMDPDVTPTILDYIMALPRGGPVNSQPIR